MTGAQRFHCFLYSSAFANPGQAGAQGFEPRPSILEIDMLPLHYAPIKGE